MFSVGSHREYGNLNFNMQDRGLLQMHHHVKIRECIDKTIKYRIQRSTKIDKIIEEYGVWVSGFISDGFNGYMLSFLFSNLGENEEVIKSRMIKAMTRVYNDSLTFIFRYPAKRPMNRLPVWIGCPDVPVFKYERQRIVETGQNNGLHAHAVVLIPPDNRLKMSFNRHLVERRERYCQHPIIEIGCENIKDNPAYVTDYVLKGLRRPRITSEDVLVLPRTRGELSR